MLIVTQMFVRKAQVFMVTVAEFVNVSVAVSIEEQLEVIAIIARHLNLIGSIRIRKLYDQTKMRTLFRRW